MANIAANYLICGKQAERLGTDHASIVPYGCLRTKDGMMAIAAGNDRQFLGLVKCLGLHERARDVRFGSNAARVEDQEVLIKQLEGVTTEQIAGSDKFAFAPVNNMKQVMSDPQVLHTDMILEMDHPSAEKIKLPGVPVKFTGGKTQNHSPPPILSQHTEIILRDILRQSNGEIQSLSSYRVVGETNQS
jgi:succinate--hydroxymethylglutarate CoA-transferase